MIGALRDGYAALVCDLDGVVYRGPAAVPHAIDALSAGTEPVHFATNNASRLPAEVAGHLVSLGLAVSAGDVSTSAEAGASELSRLIATGATVLAVGGPGVAAAAESEGFVVSRTATSDVAAVLQGYGRGVQAADLAEAAYAIQGGAIWIATNTDLTLPTDRGVAPGNGSLIGAVRLAAGRDPDLVAGKPYPPLYRLCLERMAVSPGDALAVGDRLDTDIEGANSVGIDSLLVLTGVNDLRDVLLAPPHRRPTWVAPDLRWLSRPADDPVLMDLRRTLEWGWAHQDGGPVDDGWLTQTVTRLHDLVASTATVE